MPSLLPSCLQAANIHLCGSFFRNYLAPVARRFEEVSVEAALAAAPRGEADGSVLKKNAVFDTWRSAMQRGLESSITAEADEGESAYLEKVPNKGESAYLEEGSSSGGCVSQLTLSPRPATSGGKLKPTSLDVKKVGVDTEGGQRSVKRAKNASGKALVTETMSSKVPMAAAAARARKGKGVGLSPAEAAARAAALAALEDSPSDSDSNAGDAVDEQTQTTVREEEEEEVSLMSLGAHAVLEEDDEAEIEAEIERLGCGGGGTIDHTTAKKRGLEEASEELKACKKRKEDSHFFRHASPAVQRWLKPTKVRPIHTGYCHNSLSSPSLILALFDPP